jgi:hypothetical protein
MIAVPVPSLFFSALPFNATLEGMLSDTLYEVQDSRASSDLHEV